MTSFVALLRAVNVGGHAQIAMGDVRKFIETVGGSEVKSVLQSGNLVFKSKLSSEAEIEVLLEENALEHLGRPVEFMVRSARAWKRIRRSNPFTDEAARNPSHLHVMFLKSEPGREAAASLQARVTGREYFHHQERQLYIVYPDGSGRSTFTGSLIEKTLRIRGTARNWNTVEKIAALLTAS